jgi:hypothetical protein
MSKDGKLYDVDLKKETKEVETEIFRTTKFEVRLTHEVGDETQVERLLKGLEKRNPLGGLIIPPEERKARKVDFIQQRMKPIDCAITGADYDESKKAIYKAIFNEDL